MVTSSVVVARLPLMPWFQTGCPGTEYTSRDDTGRIPPELDIKCEDR